MATVISYGPSTIVLVEEFSLVQSGTRVRLVGRLEAVHARVGECEVGDDETGQRVRVRTALVHVGAGGIGELVNVLGEAVDDGGEGEGQMVLRATSLHPVRELDLALWKLVLRRRRLFLESQVPS